MTEQIVWPELQYTSVEKEIGTDAMTFLAYTLHDWLREKPAARQDLKFRIAPSLITRSECELFALSSPRFAMRVALQDGSILNLRRLPFFQSKVDEWGYPPNSHHPDDQISYDSDRAKTKSPRDVLNESLLRPVADSFLRVPTKSVDAFHVITTSLSACYGETLDLNAQDAGVPFAQHIRLGGGMCAQVVCFSAAALMHQYATGVHGIPEISAQATNRPTTEVIPIGGLQAEEMANYFKSIGLGASIESAEQTVSQQKEWEIAPGMRSGSAMWLNELLWHATIRNYLLNDCPVIAFTDTRYMAPIYERFDAANLAGREDRIASHAVLLVGCKRANNSYVYLMNDPRYLPFMPVTGFDLTEARAVPETIGTDGKPIVKKSPPIFLRLAPPTIKLSLLLTKYPRRSPGIFEVSEQLRRAANSGRLDEKLSAVFRVSMLKHFGEFELLGPECPGNSAAAKSLRIGEEIKEQLKLFRSRFNVCNWLWLQSKRGKFEDHDVTFYLLWDAQAELSENDAAIKALYAVLIKRSGQKSPSLYWQNGERMRELAEQHKLGHRSGNYQSQPVVSPPLKKYRLRPALLSSFSPWDFKNNAALGHHHLKMRVGWSLDLYAFMQSEEFLDARETAVEYMAAHCQDDQLIQHRATQIVDESRNYHLPIVALASFIPTLSHPQDDRKATAARGALYFLHRLATWISHIQETPAIHAIEIVSGSRVMGVWPAIDRKRLLSDNELFAATMLSSDQTQENILNNLELVLTDIEKLANPSGRSPIFALEFEPGPLFAMNDWCSIQSVSKRIAARKILSDNVGLNLDVQHWKMIGISPDVVQQTPEVLNRIVHAHLSGHYPKAHFGDIPPLLINSATDYQPWLELLENCRARTSRPQYSGYISLELEACKGPDWVEAAVKDVISLLET